MQHALLRWLTVLGLSSAVAWAQPARAAAGKAFVRLDAGQAVIGNGAQERTIRLTDPVQTTTISNQLASREIAITSAEFALRLNETLVLTAAAPCDLGGQGQPIFIAGHSFVGLEYPAGLNEVVDRSKAQPPEVVILVQEKPQGNR